MAVKVAVVAPDCTSTEAGTVRAEVRLLASETVDPLEGAGAEMATVQVVEADAAKVVPAHCREEIVMGAVMEKAAEAVEAPRVAVTVAFWLALTAAAVAVKVAVVAPDCTSTEAGTVRAEVRLLASETVDPLGGAGAEMATVQVVEAEAAKVVLAHCRELICSATSERLAVTLTAFKAAVTVAG